MKQIRNRIKTIKNVRLGDIADNPRNPKFHPARQSEVIQGIVSEVGWAGVPLVYKSARLGGELSFVDGHLRKREFPDLEVKVAVTDLTDEEADYLLVTYDPVGSLAVLERDKMTELLENISSDSEAINAFLVDLEAREMLGDDEDIDWMSMFEDGAPVDSLTHKNLTFVIPLERYPYVIEVLASLDKDKNTALIKALDNIVTDNNLQGNIIN